jgi:hypothetical protein
MLILYVLDLHEERVFPSIPKGDIVDYLGWLSLMSTLEESLVANSGSTKVWVMDPSLFDV